MIETQTILCVEDDPDACELLRFVLENEGFRVVSCAKSEEALQLASKNRYSAIILDHRLEDISGVEICRQIRSYDEQTPIIFYTASGFPTERQAGLEAGANEYLVKPGDFDHIVDNVKRLVL